MVCLFSSVSKITVLPLLGGLGRAQLGLHSFLGGLLIGGVGSRVETRGTLLTTGARRRDASRCNFVSAERRFSQGRPVGGGGGSRHGRGVERLL